MNNAWKQYIEETNKLYKELPSEFKNNFTDSEVQEIIMRMWVEVKAFELIPPEYSDFALVCLRRSIVDKVLYFYK